MKRDWEQIKEVLYRVEALDLGRMLYARRSEDSVLFYHARLLSRNRYLVVIGKSLDAITIEDLTLKGHDLLDRLRDGTCGPSPLDA